MSTVENQRIKTDGHDIVLGKHSLAELAELLATEAFAGVKVFILVDENTLKFCLPLLMGKVESLRDAEVIEIGSGEENKRVEVAIQLWKVLGELDADRQSLLINLGGGVITDLGGFVAGTFKRGIRFINVPTTLLAQVDASIGAKVGIDLEHIKNEVGLFKNPVGVFIDPTFLNTLPRNQVLSGFAEMIKHALIASPGYWESIKGISLLEPDQIDRAIMRSIEIKNEIVASDPFERGRRKVLNFGHTIGHAVESHSIEGDMKALLHGEAIAMGMVCEAFLSHRRGLLNESALQEITAFVFSLYPRVEIDQVRYHRIIELMRHDKKNRNGSMQFSLLDGIGDSVYDQEITADLVIDSLNFYQRWVG